MDRYHGELCQWCLAVEDDASRRVFDMIESDSRSASQSVELLDSVREELEAPVPILKVIAGHGSECTNAHKGDQACLAHGFERYLHEEAIKHTLCTGGQPQSNGNIEPFIQT